MEDVVVVLGCLLEPNEAVGLRDGSSVNLHDCIRVRQGAGLLDPGLEVVGVPELKYHFVRGIHTNYWHDDPVLLHRDNRRYRQVPGPNEQNLQLLGMPHEARVVQHIIKHDEKPKKLLMALALLVFDDSLLFSQNVGQDGFVISFVAVLGRVEAALLDEALHRFPGVIDVYRVTEDMQAGGKAIGIDVCDLTDEQDSFPAPRRREDELPGRKYRDVRVVTLLVPVGLARQRLRFVVMRHEGLPFFLRDYKHGSMESHLASKDSSITSQFVHKIPSTTDWCTDRRMVRWYNAGGSHFSPNGVKVIRFDLNCSGNEMLDPLSTTIQLKLKNDSYDGSADKNIHLVNGAYCLIKRIVVRCGGVTASDEDYVNRSYHQGLNFAPQNARDNLAVAAGQKGTIVTDEATFAFPILAPIFEQEKALPLSFMSLSITLELVDNINDILVKTADLPGGVNAQATAWHIEEPIIMGSVMVLDSSLASEFSNHLLKGKTLSIPMVQRMTVPHVITTGAGGYQIAMTRSLTRIKAIFQSFTHVTNDKYAYDFKWPALSSSAMLEWQAFIGSKRYPEAPMSTTCEMWFKLMEAIGLHHNVFANSAIQLSDYTSDSFTVAVNLQKVLYADDPAGSFAGVSTKMGDLLSFHAKNVTANVNTAWTCIYYDSILTVSEEGCALYD